MNVLATSFRISEGGTAHSVAITATSAQSQVIEAADVVITPTVDVFVRRGANPTAVANGTDDFLKGGNSYRLRDFQRGQKLAFIKAGANDGTVYVSPNA